MRLGLMVSLVLLTGFWPWAEALPNTLSEETMTIASAELTPEMALERLFTSPNLSADWFAESFLAQISLTQMQQLIQEITRTLGAYQGLEVTPERNWVIFEQGRVSVQISLSSQGQIEGLLFDPPTLNVSSLEDLQTAFEDLPGEASLLILKDGVEQLAVNADQPLGVGSAFKLLVLQALNNQILAQEHQWDEVVTLQAEHVSLPSGRLQSWPLGSPLTLHTLATLMISESDNTATDHLLALVGREAVASLSPRNQPFLSTQDFFLLKDPQNQAELERYRVGDLAARQQVLADLADAPLPPVSIFNQGPVALDVEWFLTTRELCAAIATVSSLPLMSVNPGLADPQAWQRVAFKGGSEPGVENLTTYLETTDGHQYCVAATWNHPEGIDELKFVSLYRSALSGLP